MKYISKISLAALGLVSILSACNKIDPVDPLPAYANGVSSSLSSSVTTIAPPVADSNKAVVTFNWTNPHYANDSNTTRYIIQIDSASRNFARAISTTVIGGLTKTFLAKEINTMVLDLGLKYNVQGSVEVRIISSYNNNNEQLKSNTLTLAVKPYVTPPKVVPPTSNKLFLVGSATATAWNNPVGQGQQFTRLDSVTYEGTFYMNGGQEYLMLPVNGDWTHKFAVADKNLPGLSNGGVFGFDLNDNIPGPANTGMYKIRVDFQRGFFTVTKVKQYGQIWIPGAYQNWAPDTAPSAGSPNADGVYDTYINIPAGGGGFNEFKFTSIPDWAGTNYGSGGGNTLSTSNTASNLTVPTAGFYRIHADINAMTWYATKTTWSMIGSFAASQWNNDIQMTFDAGNKWWSGTITVTGSDEFKFRANNDWNLNYGDTGADGSLEEGGDNIKNLTPGTHTIYLFLNNSGYYTYRIQ
jgi:hypothetical protein